MQSQRHGTQEGITSKGPSSRIDFLDGIRALAALWVMLSHIWITQFGIVVHTGLIGELTNWTLYSHLAVDVFIVLSGFCLILPRLRKPTEPVDIVNFYRRRARRILPPYYCALVIGVLVSVATRRMADGTWHLNGGNLLANLFLVQDALIERDTFNGPSWSVAVEWRIYFLFPAVVFLLFRYGRWAVLAAAALLGYGLTAAILHWEPAMLMASPWYLLLFAFGACAGYSALGSGRGKAFAAPLSTCALVCSGVCLWLYRLKPGDISTFGAHMPLVDLFVGMLSASVLVVLATQTPNAFALRMLAWRPLANLGVMSYSLYLVHLPILMTLNCLMMRYPIGMLSSSLGRVAALIVLGIPAIFGISYCFFWTIERPLLRR